MKKTIETTETQAEFAQTEETKVAEVKYAQTFIDKELAVIFSLSAGLWILHNYLLFDYTNWIWIPIFWILFIWAYLYLLNIFWKKPGINTYLIWSLYLMLSIWSSIRASSLLNTFNFIWIVFCMLVLIYLWFKDEFKKIKMFDYTLWIFETWFSILWAIKIFSWDVTESRKNTKRWELSIHLVKWILMAIPLLLVFIGLFSMADMAFNKVIWEMFDFMLPDNLIARIINIVFYFVLYLWIFSHIWKSIRKPESDNRDVFVFEHKKHLEINIIISAMILVFLLFVFVQFKYLFNWEEFIKAMWFTYSDYASSWFNELIFISLLTSLILWKADHYLYRHEMKGESNIYKILTSLLIILTMIVLWSAYYRLKMYQNAYWLTEIRFYSNILIICIWISLLIFLYKILRFIAEWRFISYIVAVFASALVICNIINPESYISYSNETKDYSRSSLVFDSVYVWHFSEDAIDNMINIRGKLLWSYKDNMDDELCNKLDRLRNWGKWWQEMNYSKSHALISLLKIEKDINCTRFVNPSFETSNFWVYKTVADTDKPASDLYNEWVYYIKSKEYPNAIEAFKLWLSKDPNNEKMLLELWNAYFLNWDSVNWFLAYEWWMKICSSECKSYFFNMWYEKTFEGEYSEAITYLDKAIAADPGFQDAIVFKWQALYLQNRFADAINVLSAEAVKSPEWECTCYYFYANYYVWASYFAMWRPYDALPYAKNALNTTFNDESVKLNNAINFAINQINIASRSWGLAPNLSWPMVPPSSMKILSKWLLIYPEWEEY
ncbi:MAG: hypothetical protein ACD_2C00008G0001 [uncultured bacterium (gcode 4)]|uniref:Uncharacterized protein n=1 Tax=uncultured bacterium (gcode 4) TaxID=1234023 RepID=K2G4X9_9BACT|nr:MAG: hypothetical protein ACD_2C00008G0001 [uncultured bacterium (gcode 4)]